MKAGKLLAGAALALTSAWAIAQDAPESLLPPGFDRPAPRAAPAAPNPGQPAAPRIEPQTVVPADPAGVPEVTAAPTPSRIPTLKELETLSADQLAEMLGLRSNTDMPAAARRAMSRIGVLDEAEGGLPSTSLIGQNPSLVRAAISGNKGAMVSRWGHILLRRALASRLDAPAGIDPADFAALRASLLVRMGEGDAARALVQDIDTGNFTPALTQAALDAYVATADFTGMCPAVTLQGGARKDGQWEVARGICAAYGGDANAMGMLDRALGRGVMPKIDVLLAQKYAGAAGKARRAVKIEWDGVKEMTPWRYALAIAVGLQPPEALMRDAPARYDYMAATAPMLGLPVRAAAADRAAAAGIVSSAAMVDLYSQIYAQDDVGEDWSARAEVLRSAYVAASAADRLAAMKRLWDGGSGSAQRYSRQVLTAYAAARLPASEALVDDAPAILASMLSAGLDGNAVRWGKLLEEGSEGWGQLIVAAPSINGQVSAGALSTFNDSDDSEEARKSGFLLAGLAGLGRISPDTARDFAGDLDIDLYRASRWSRLIDQAAEVNNVTLVVLLAGVGMQGDGWDRMTPRHLYHIVAALNRVGLNAEARMIAAEAVARG